MRGRVRSFDEGTDRIRWEVMGFGEATRPKKKRQKLWGRYQSDLWGRDLKGREHWGGR